MENHSAPLTMTMMIMVGIVQHYMVEGGGLLAATTVSLLVPTPVEIYGMRSIGALEQHPVQSHMWK